MSAGAAPGGPAHEPADLLAFALFNDNPAVGSYRETLLAFLVCACLFELDRPATRRELFEDCVERFLPNGDLHLHEVEKVIAVARKHSLLVDAGDCRVSLSSERHENLKEASERVELVREAFHQEICQAVEEELGEPLGDDLRGVMRTMIEGFIQRIFQEHSVALAVVFGKDGQGLDGLNSTGEFTLASLRVLVRSLTDPSEKVKQAQIAGGIQRGIMGLGWQGKRYLAAVYKKTVAFALLQQDPKVKRIRRELMEGRVFYLDANVLMALLFPSDRGHGQVRNAVEVARDLNCELRVSPATVKELEVRIGKSNERYEKFKPYDDLDFSILDDVVLRTFRARQVENPHLSWRGFLAGYLPVASALGEMEIVASDEDAVRATHDGRWAQVREAVLKNKPPYKRSPNAVDADTANLLLVQLLRESIHADAMGRRVWLVTLDQTLKYAERELINRNVYAVPSTKRVASWVSVLGPHLPPEDEDLGKYVLRVFRSGMGLVSEDPLLANVDFVADLAESPFDLGGLIRSSRDKTQRVLVALSKEREIADVLDEEPTRPTEREAWGERLSEVILDALRRMEDSSTRADGLEAELREAVIHVEGLKRESKDHMRRIEELQAEIRAEQPVEPGLLTKLRWRLTGAPKDPS